MRAATLTLAFIVVGTVACNDLRDFAGPWAGNRVGDAPSLRIGDGTAAQLVIDNIDKHGLRGQLSVTGAPIDAAAIVSIEGAEADALATMTFSGAPMRVYMAFVPATDGAGDVLAIIALYDSRRIELRLLRGAPSPIYAIYALTESS